MGHYAGEMESPREAAGRLAYSRGIDLLHEAGYWNPGVQGSEIPLHHLPCGQAVYDPAVHDPLCPANDKGRTEPRLLQS